MHFSKVGKSNVSWLRSQLGSEEEALFIGNLMVAANIINHVVGGHLLKGSDSSGESSNSILDGFSSFGDLTNDANLYGSITEPSTWITSGSSDGSSSQGGIAPSPPFSPSDLSLRDLESLAANMKVATQNSPSTS